MTWRALRALVLLFLSSCITNPLQVAAYSHGLGAAVGVDAYEGDDAMVEIPATDAKADADAGRLLFRKHCADCHGPAGLGNGPTGRAMDPRPPNLVATTGRYNQRQLYALIAGGRNDMPTWREVLSDKEIWQVVRHVNGFNQEKETP